MAAWFYFCASKVQAQWRSELDNAHLISTNFTISVLLRAKFRQVTIMLDLCMTTTVANVVCFRFSCLRVTAIAVCPSGVMESKAAFKARAEEIGVAEEVVAKLGESNVATFGQYAFIAPNNPSSSDEKEFKDAIESIMERPVSAPEMVGFRRLWFESHAVAMSDLRNRVERSSSDPPKQVPLAERMLRLKRQRDELKGVIIDSHSEPAHSLIDKIQSMVEENCLSYLGPEKCMSREQEIVKDKAEPVLAFNNDGNIRLSKRSVDLQCDVTGETKLRNALTRRSLAFDQIGILSFTAMELWHNTMFRALQKQPPAGYKFVSVQQILAADKELFTIVSQHSRGELRIVAGSPAPLDGFFQKYMDSSEVVCYMNPLPASQQSNPPVRDKAAENPGGVKGKGDNRGKEKAKVKDHPLLTFWKTCQTIVWARCRMENFCVYDIRLVSAITNVRSDATMDFTSAISRDVTRTDLIQSATTDTLRTQCMREFLQRCMLILVWNQRLVNHQPLLSSWSYVQDLQRLVLQPKNVAFKYFPSTSTGIDFHPNAESWKWICHIQRVPDFWIQWFTKWTQ